MSKGLNKCEFIGNVTRDPEYRVASNGGELVKFSIAVNDRYKDKTTGAPVETVEYINLVAFRNLANVINQYIKKGSKVYVCGNMKTTKYQDKETGADKYSTSIVVNDLLMLDGNPNQAPAAPQGGNAPQAPPPLNNQNQAPQQAGGNWDSFDDDIPF